MGLGIGIGPNGRRVIASFVLQVQEVIIATGVDWQDDTIAGGLVTNTCWLVE